MAEEADSMEHMVATSSDTWYSSLWISVFASIGSSGNSAIRLKVDLIGRLTDCSQIGRASDDDKHKGAVRSVGYKRRTQDGFIQRGSLYEGFKLRK